MERAAFIAGQLCPMDKKQLDKRIIDVYPTAVLILKTNP